METHVGICWGFSVEDGAMYPVAKFIIPDRGLKSTMALGCRNGPPAYVAWRAGTTSLCHCRLYPPGQGLRMRPLDFPLYCAGISKQSMGERNRVGIG